jgi:hypothetical protein
MTEYKITKEGGIWKAVVWIGGSAGTLTLIGTNLSWILQQLATLFGFK